MASLIFFCCTKCVALSLGIKKKTLKVCFSKQKNLLEQKTTVSYNLDSFNITAGNKMWAWVSEWDRKYFKVKRIVKAAAAALNPILNPILLGGMRYFVLFCFVLFGNVGIVFQKVMLQQQQQQKEAEII